MHDDFYLQVEVDIHDDQVRLLKKNVARVFQILNILPDSTTILLSDDQRIQALNRDYRNFDKPTDVLSFPGGDPLPGIPESERYLGDIIISVPTASRQAQASGNSLDGELCLLVIHGILHLLGYDHESSSEKETMWHKQEEILLSLGYENISPTES